MTSTINTGSIDVNFPTPGVNNSSQGFRTNFAAIRNNLTTAGTEISDLQNKAILKAALLGTTLNNDMNNAQISNALTLGFRASTYNLGNNLSGPVIIDVTNGDVQYGVITGNIQLQFAKWAPTGTQSNVQVVLQIGNSLATIDLPSNVTNGFTTIQNYVSNGQFPGGQIGLPSDSIQVHYLFSTLDCGTNIEIAPMDHPRQSQQIVKRIVTDQIGRQGDYSGDVCIGAGFGIDTIDVVSSGTTYTAATVVIPLPDVDGGVQATATANLAAGIITSIDVTESGSGYLYAPVISIVDPTSSGSGATASATLLEIPNYMYFCTNDYDDSTLIWNKVATQSW
jgi:hypothetical protein